MADPILRIDYPGSGYLTDAQNVSVLGGSGQGLTIDYTVNQTYGIDTVTVNQPGSGYFDNEDVYLEAGVGAPPTEGLSVSPISGTLKNFDGITINTFDNDPEYVSHIRLTNSTYSYDDVTIYADEDSYARVIDMTWTVINKHLWVKDKVNGLYWPRRFESLGQLSILRLIIPLFYNEWDDGVLRRIDNQDYGGNLPNINYGSEGFLAQLQYVEDQEGNIWTDQIVWERTDIGVISEPALLNVVENNDLFQGPDNIELSIIPTYGPISLEEAILPNTGPADIQLSVLPSIGPREVNTYKLAETGPKNINYELLPSSGPKSLGLLDARSVKLEELSNAVKEPDKGKASIDPACDVATGPKSVTLTTLPILVDGYYPLYTTEEQANQASPLNTNHTHELKGVTYYMPDGLDQMWHGTFREPLNGPGSVKSVLVAVGRTKTPKYISHIFDSKVNALTGPFTYGGITTITSRDNSSEVYAVDDKYNVVMSTLNDLKETNFDFPSHRILTYESFDLENEEGVVASEKGEFMYRGKFLSSPFADDLRIEGQIENPLFFKDCYLSIAETNWMHLGSESTTKDLYRVDLTFEESSLGHVWLYAINESKKVSGQYKGEIRDNMKVFTNLRGKRFKIKMFVATHKDFPWSMREMSLGYNQGKNF